MNTPAQRHERYQVQAGWTKALRQYVMDKINLRKSAKVLEVGSGTGVILSSLADSGYAQITGVDISRSELNHLPSPHQFNLIQANAYQLPIGSTAYDAVVCHYFLLWLSNPAAALQEMTRVLKPGGWLFAFAEPDYEARVDFPARFSELGALQNASLTKQGANPGFGRHLPALFSKLNLAEVQWGILGYESTLSAEASNNASEMLTLQYDLQQLGQTYEIPLDEQAWHFIPTFWAIGQKR